MYGGIEDGGETGLLSSMGAEAFSEASVRSGFIRKVYGILAVQLVVTMGLIGIFYIPQVAEYNVHNSWPFWLAFVATFCCLIAMACFSDVRRKTPGNFICLSIFTLAEGFLMGTAAAQYTADEVLIAVGITLVLVVALTVFAWQSKIDFTLMGGTLLIGLLILMIIGIVGIFVRTKIMSIVYASIGAFIFSFYILYDTQLMMGGKHRYALDPEEYIFAALNLYLDIINLLLFILQIIGNARH